MANRFVIDIVDVLQNGKRADFTDDPDGQPIHALNIVSDKEELVAKMCEVGLDALAHFSENNRERFGILLVGA